MVEDLRPRHYIDDYETDAVARSAFYLGQLLCHLQRKGR